MNIDADEVTKEFLCHQGMVPGVVVEVLAVAVDGSLLLDISDQHLSLSQMLASGIELILAIAAE